MMPKLDQAAFLRGLDAYRHGLSVRDVAAKSFDDMDRAFARPVEGQEPPDPRAIEAESKSFILGFVEGLVADIRKVAGSTRTGQKA